MGPPRLDRRALAAAVAGCTFAAAAGLAGARGRDGAAEGETAAAAAFARSRRRVELPAGRIAYAERGHGPAALFVHGFPLNGYQWRGVMARLAPQRRCLAPDLPGLGYTRPARGRSFAPAAQADMLAAFLDALDVDSADVVANDSGGAVAQLLHARHPGRVRSLLLSNCDSAIECPPPALSPVIELARQGRFVPEWLAPWLADKALARSATGLGGQTYTFPERLSDAAIDTYLAPLVAEPARTHGYALALAANSLAGNESVQRASRIPVRIVWGTGDDIFSRRGAQHLHASFGGSRGIRWVEGARLFFPEEYPDLVAAEVRALWQD